MAGDVTDQELRGINLKLRDPYDQPDLIWEIPINATLDSILNIYEFELWPAKKVFCVKCKGHRHKHGFTARLGDGNRTLLGSSCGAKIFGESWIQAEKGMRAQGDRQWELARLDRLALILRPMRNALFGWEIAMDNLMARKAGFLSGAGELASSVSAAANYHGGQLTVRREIDTTAARQGGMRGLSQGPEYATVVVGEFNGAALFQHFDAAKAVASAQRALAGFGDSLAGEGTDRVSTAALRLRRGAFEGTFAGLELAATMYEAGRQFFTRETFERIVEWTQRHSVTRDRYVFDGKLISYEDGRDRGVQLPPEPLKVLDRTPLDLIQKYRRLVE